MIFQCTLARPIVISGIGLHCGQRIDMTLRPADAGKGIVFHRRAGGSTVSIEALSANVVDTRLATVLGKEDVTVSTVEHLLATLASFGIDNLHIDIDGPEVPIMDGSAAPFAGLLKRAGVRRLPRGRKFLAVRKPISLLDGERRISLSPSRFFRLTFDIAYDHPCISVQHRTFRLSPASFTRDIAPARTFGFLMEVEHLRSRGLVRGGSLENAVVVGEDAILNPEGLRFPDEFVRHKILDAIGDFSLLGYPLMGHLEACRTGHDFNHRMVQTILASPDCWKLVEFREPDPTETSPARSRGFASGFAPSKS